MEFYRVLIKDERVVEWSFLAGPYGTPGMAQSQGTREVNHARFWDGPAKVFKVQRLEAVLDYTWDTQLDDIKARLEWVDYVK